MYEFDPFEGGDLKYEQPLYIILNRTLRVTLLSLFMVNFEVF